VCLNSTWLNFPGCSKVRERERERERERATEKILNNKSQKAASEWLENLDFGAGTENSYQKKKKI